jgi:excisionase family DNA binding protein
MRDKGIALPAGQGQSSYELPAEERPYKVAEVAKFLRQRPETLYDWIRDGKLHATRYGGTYYIPRWVLAPLLSPAGDPRAEPASAPAGGDAA